MRILILTTSFPSLRAPYNGVFVREHARRLAVLNNDVRLIVPRIFREDPMRTSDDGVSVRRFPFLSAQKLLVQYKRVPVVRIMTLLVFGLVSTIASVRDQRSEIIHAHWAIPTGLIAVVAGRLTRVPVVVTVHRADLVLALEGPRVARFLMQYALDRAAQVVVVSEQQVGEMTATFGLPASKVSAIPMGADTELFAPASRRMARRQLDVSPDADLVLFVGGLTVVKGVRELIQAVPQLCEDHPELLLFIGGEGPLMDEILDTAVELGVSNKVRLLGALDHDQLPTYMNAADVLVLPSHSEGLPVVLMEAAAAGLPIVATRVGGSAEIASLNPRNRVIEPGVPEQISIAISDLLSMASMPDVREAAIEPCSRYALSGSIERLLAVYRNVSGSIADSGVEV